MIYCGQDTGGFVRTVAGDVAPAELGITYTHEHLFTRPAERLADGGDLVLDDENLAAAELALFRQAGGRSMVDVTTREFGRGARALRRIARRSGVHVVAVTGHVTEEYWRDVVDIGSMTPAALMTEMLTDLTAGMDGSTVRAGVIKAGSSRDGATAAERTVLRAAAMAQQRTGAPITTHTTAGTAALEQADILLASGARADHVCIGHLDRNLDWESHLELAQTGVYLGYDCMSKDWYQPDSRRVEFIRRLVAEGFGDRICVSGDLARRSSLVSWGGGPGYPHILWRIVPWLRRAGLTQDQIDTILVANPARFLTWA
jgi:predicted metal-dependent phosphotriesterase family hydrolase